MQIDGSGVFVTGGASGLGEATARLLASRGAKVAIFDLPRSKGAELAREIGKGTLFVAGDVTSEEQVGAALEQAIASFGELRGLVNCAGIGSASRTVGKDGKPFDLGVFTRTIQVNLIGTFNVIRLAAARMIGNAPDAEGERGAIVNTASVAAFEGQIGQAAYSASKGGVVGMTLPIARDLARHGIRCCTIAPGLFATPLLMTLPQAARDALAASIPFPQRLGRPAEYAALACQILENTALNGETIRIDCALRMAPQ
jgi:NAD(P)-dependent dehydrogenase (short-subunit alcohol dehydrogenase family)